MYNKICELCRSDYTTTQKKSKFCSSKCRMDNHLILYGRKVVGTKISTGNAGSIAELVVAADLLKKGYSVFRSLSPSCYCDLIATKDDTTYEIEVRTGYMGVNKKLYFPKNIKGKVNLFGIWERNTGIVSYLNLELKNIKIN